MRVSLLHRAATVRKPDAVTRSNLTDFGKLVADCLPKYVQKAQLTSGDELEILICPEGVVPVLSFLKDHHNAQFANLVDIAGMDVPSRQYRFEVCVRCPSSAEQSGDRFGIRLSRRSSTTSCRCATIRAFASRPTPTS